MFYDERAALDTSRVHLSAGANKFAVSGVAIYFAVGRANPDYQKSATAATGKRHAPVAWIERCGAYLLKIKLKIRTCSVFHRAFGRKIPDWYLKEGSWPKYISGEYLSYAK